jgi:ferrous iron transport protein A
MMQLICGECSTPLRKSPQIQYLDSNLRQQDNGSVMQLSFNRRSDETGAPRQRLARKLVDLREGEQAVLERLELPDDMARRLMELGFLPGNTVVAARCAPGGDPRVFRVDGSEIALRAETASQLYLKM